MVSACTERMMMTDAGVISPGKAKPLSSGLSQSPASTTSISRNDGATAFKTVCKAERYARYGGIEGWRAGRLLYAWTEPLGPCHSNTFSQVWTSITCIRTEWRQGAQETLFRSLRRTNTSHDMTAALTCCLLPTRAA
jgi:hypothetical protein